LQEDIDFGELKKRLKYLKATSLQSMRTKLLALVISRFRDKKVIALWGREGKVKRGSKKDDLSVSFGQNHNLSGFEFFMKGMYKAALEEFQLALQLDSRFAAALNNLGTSLAKEGKFEEARLKLEEAVSVNPDSAVMRNNLGAVYLLLGQLDQAMLELGKASELDPQLSALAINLGDLHFLRGEAQPALQLYQQVGKYDILTEIAEERLMYKNL